MLAALEIKLEPIDFEQTVILESPLPLSAWQARLGQAGDPGKLSPDPALTSHQSARGCKANLLELKSDLEGGEGEGQFVTPLSFDKVITTKI